MYIYISLSLDMCIYMYVDDCFMISCELCLVFIGFALCSVRPTVDIKFILGQ